MAVRLVDKCLPVGFVLVDHFRIDGILGQGGFGTTYLAFDTQLDCPVAIKEYNPDFATRQSDYTIMPATESDRDSYQWGYNSFLKEARLLAKFHHPNIVKIRHIFKAHETAYIVMDYERGESLLEQFNLHGTVTTTHDLLRYLLPIVEGLQTVHQRDFLHRDIKPHNIFIRTDGTPLLLDFGSARMQGSDATRTVHPGYTPIEQFDDVHHEGPFTDIYALGATLYHIVTGKPPVSALKRQTDLSLSGSDPYVPISREDIHGEGSVQLVNAINDSLIQNPEHRPQSLFDWNINTATAIEDDERTRVYNAVSNNATVACSEAGNSRAANSGAAGVVAGSAMPEPRSSNRIIGGVAALAVVAGLTGAGLWLGKSTLPRLTESDQSTLGSDEKDTKQQVENVPADVLATDDEVIADTDIENVATIKQEIAPQALVNLNVSEGTVHAEPDSVSGLIDAPVSLSSDTNVSEPAVVADDSPEQSNLSKQANSDELEDLNDDVRPVDVMPDVADADTKIELSEPLNDNEALPASAGLTFSVPSYDPLLDDDISSREPEGIGAGSAVALSLNNGPADSTDGLSAQEAKDSLKSESLDIAASVDAIDQVADAAADVVPPVPEIADAVTASFAVLPMAEGTDDVPQANATGLLVDPRPVDDIVAPVQTGGELDDSRNSSDLVDPWNSKLIAGLPMAKPDLLINDDDEISVAAPATETQPATLALMQEFEDYKQLLLQDRENYRGRGQEIQLDDGLDLLQQISANSPDAEWLVEQYGTLLQEMTSGPGYTISSNGAGTGTAMDVVKSGAVAGLGTSHMKLSSDVIGNAYAQLVDYSPNPSTRRMNLNSWSTAISSIETLAEEQGIVDDWNQSGNRQKISDYYQRFSAANNDESIVYLQHWNEYLATIRDDDQLWLNEAWSQYAQTEQSAGSCRSQVNSVFAYSKIIGVGDKFATYRFPGKSKLDFNGLVSQLKSFCNVQCVDVWGKNRRIRGDMIKQLKKQGVSARYRQMSKGFAMDYEYVQVYAVDSSCER